jgi:N-ethylmaleimide reductase
MTDLFTPLQLGPYTLPNRIFLAPLTRCRADAGHVPNALMADYYAQRASGGLLIAEATMAMAGNSAFWREPGVYDDAQVAGWKLVTKAVHDKGGRIFLQVWHGGRATHSLLNNGQMPVGASAIAITDSETHTPKGKKPYETPRVLEDSELPGIVKGFGKAFENAKRAGFDGVEVHGANGYLLDQFLRDGSNQRQGRYGGSLENRARLLLEVAQAACDTWGKGRVGVRISPLNSYNSMKDSDPVGLATFVAQRLSELPLGYLHLMRADFYGAQKGDVLTPVRKAYRGVLVANMGYTPDEAQAAVQGGAADAIAFGTSFLANPDLPRRIREKAPLNQPDQKTFYTPGARGYTDYPALG